MEEERSAPSLTKAQKNRLWRKQKAQEYQRQLKPEDGEKIKQLLAKKLEKSARKDARRAVNKLKDSLKHFKTGATLATQGEEMGEGVIVLARTEKEAAEKRMAKSLERQNLARAFQNKAPINKDAKKILMQETFNKK